MGVAVGVLDGVKVGLRVGAILSGERLVRNMNSDLKK